jgi:ParB family chromosome partitioning protein
LTEGSSISARTGGLLVDIDIYRIRHSPLFSRRVSFSKNVYKSLLSDLTKSIAQQGLLQPIIVRTKNRTDYFEIVAGNRRYEACMALGWRKIICHVLELEDREAFEVTLIENIQRENLNPIQEAHAFKIYVNEFGWGGITHLASKLGKSVSYVDKRIRLLNSPAELIESVSNHSISPSTAEELVHLNDEGTIHEFVGMINQKRLSSRKVRQLVKEHIEFSSSSMYDFKQNDYKIVDIDRKVQRSFDKSIVALRIAMSRLATIIESMEDNWVVYEILMQHKNMLHSQIDLLIKEKKKL